MTAQTPLQSKELYDAQAPIQPQVAIPSDLEASLATDYIPQTAIATDGALTTNSDAKIPSQKAVKTYADAVQAAAESYTDTAVTNMITTANKVSDLTALGQANVAAIGNSATGTQIATAVNGILAILIAAGLMDAP